MTSALSPSRMLLFASAGARRLQRVLGTTPNMAPPSRRKVPSVQRVSSRLPRGWRARIRESSPGQATGCEETGVTTSGYMSLT